MNTVLTGSGVIPAGSPHDDPRFKSMQAPQKQDPKQQYTPPQLGQTKIPPKGGNQQQG